MPIAALICLCGAPFEPGRGGFVEGFGRDMARFLRDYQRLAGLVEHQTAATVGGFANGRFAEAGALDEQALPKKLKKLEKNIGRVMAARDPGRWTLVGRHWKPPTRQPETQSGRAWLAVELQKRGLSFLKARETVQAIFAAMAEALRHGEDVETPLGKFEVVYGPREQTRVRFGKTQTLFRNYKRLRFRPDRGLKRSLALPAQQKDLFTDDDHKEGLPVTSYRTIDPLIVCPRCGGTSLTVQRFCQYREGIHTAPGADISPVGEHHYIPRYVCLCGYVLAARRTGSQDKEAYESCGESWKAANRHRAGLAEELLAALEGRFASVESLKSFLDRLAADEAAIKVLKEGC